jgi:hypothetical protein
MSKRAKRKKKKKRDKEKTREMREGRTKGFFPFVFVPLVGRSVGRSVGRLQAAWFSVSSANSEFNLSCVYGTAAASAGANQLRGGGLLMTTKLDTDTVTKFSLTVQLK